MIGQYGGAASRVVNGGPLRYVLEAVQGRLFGISRYPTLVEKAAAIGYEIVRSHVFADGNKRTAFEVVALTLELNGFTIVATDQEIETTFNDLAAGDMSYDDLVAWVNEHSSRIEPEADQELNPR